MNSTIEDLQRTYGSRLAVRALELEAVKLAPADPFQWASGYRMPIYNDNRRFLGDASARALIAEAFASMIEASGVRPDCVAGTATAGIPHATTLADRLALPLAYVRPVGKGHGMRNLIEGLDGSGSFRGAAVVLIEDLISTGGSSIKAVEAIRAAGGDVSLCLAIFTYGLRTAIDAFASLECPCRAVALFDYDMLVSTALATGYVDEAGSRLLNQWRADPFGWGAAHGFPPVTEG